MLAAGSRAAFTGGKAGWETAGLVAAGWVSASDANSAWGCSGGGLGRERQLIGEAEI